MVRVRLDCLQDLHAAEAGHHAVEQDCVDAGGFGQKFERYVAVAGLDDLITSRGQMLGENVSVELIVIDREDFLPHRLTPAPFGCGARVTITDNADEAATLSNKFC